MNLKAVVDRVALAANSSEASTNIAILDTYMSMPKTALDDLGLEPKGQSKCGLLHRGKAYPVCL